MPFSPEVEQLIQQIEQTSGLPVNIAEEPGMRVRANVVPARGLAPAHLVRFKPGSVHLDYVIASQLMILQRRLLLPEAERWDIAATTDEQDVGIRLLGLDVFNDDFARSMMGQVITQARSYPVGLRVDADIWSEMPGLRSEQEAEIRSQLSENQRALAPEIRSKFPKGIVDANTSMNAAFATYWAGLFDEPRFTIPFTALGYKSIADRLLSSLDETPSNPGGDRLLVERWVGELGLSNACHFSLQSA